MRRLPMGYVRAPGSRTLNALLSRFGLGADLVVVDCNAGYTFGRRETVNDPAEVAKADQPDATDKDRAKVRTPDQLAERRTELRASVNQLAHALKIPMAPLDANSGVRPLITGVGYDPRPHRLPKDQLVQAATGHGFLVDEYAHGPSLGLVLPANLARDIALLTPFADSPPVFLVYVGYTRHGEPLVVTATAQANWLMLGGGVFDFDGSIDQPVYDLLGRLVAGVKSKVEMAGGDFENNNLLAFVGPGASEDFKIVDKYDRIGRDDWDRYVHTKEVPTGEGDETKDIDYLNLRGYTVGVLHRRGVPLGNMFELAHDTVTSLCYSSKRARLGQARADGSTPVPSNAMVLSIRERHEDDEIL